MWDKPLLELGRLRRAGERNDVADVLHAGDEEYQALETEAEAGMGAGAPAAGVDVPPQMGLVHLAALYL